RKWVAWAGSAVCTRNTDCAKRFKVAGYLADFSKETRIISGPNPCRRHSGRGTDGTLAGRGDHGTMVEKMGINCRWSSGYMRLAKRSSSSESLRATDASTDASAGARFCAGPQGPARP